MIFFYCKSYKYYSFAEFEVTWLRLKKRKEEYYIQFLTFVIGPATKVLHLYFEIKVLNSLNFLIFLENNKHVLFHRLYPSIPCCECQPLSLEAPLKTAAVLNLSLISCLKLMKERNLNVMNGKKGINK